MIDDDVGVTLERAIKNVAMNRLLGELRNAVTLGPPVLGEIYAEFQRLQAEQEKEHDEQDYNEPYPKP
jgi:hypothetical protein